MGYYTNFTLECYYKTPHNILPFEWTAQIGKEINKMNVFNAPEHSGWLPPLNRSEIKWYHWEEDMLLLSSKFPDILFVLYGEGEDADDLWNAYFIDGKVQICKAEITYPNFDTQLMEKKNICNKRYSYQEE